MTTRSVSGDDLLSKYTARFGTPPDRVAQEFISSAVVVCHVCGFERFVNSKSGTSEFYTWIAEVQGYPEERWEFRPALACMRDLGVESVLDFGSGSGNFAELATRAGLDVTCIESNERVRWALEQRGLVGFTSLEELPNKTYDAIVAMQVMEHLEDPLADARGLLKYLRLGGIFLVSVPNSRRSNAGSVDALDYPPHHLSRYNPATLALFLQTIGLTEVRVYEEPPSVSTGADFLSSLLGNPFLARIGYQIVVRTKWAQENARRLLKSGVRGHSILGVGIRTAE